MPAERVFTGATVALVVGIATALAFAWQRAEADAVGRRIVELAAADDLESGCKGGGNASATGERNIRVAAGNAVRGNIEDAQAEAAIALLRERLRHRPSAESWSDLAAVLAEQGRASDTIQPLVVALDAAERAVLYAPASPVAWTRLAGVARRLQLRTLAAYAAQRAGLDDCPDGGALPGDALFESRLAAAVRQPEALDASNAPDLVASVLEREALPRWARSLRHGERASAADAWRLAARLMDALFSVTGDPQWRDLRLAMEAGRTGPGGTRIAEAWLAYAELLEAFDSERFEQVAPALTRARSLVRPDDHPLAELLMVETAASLRLEGSGAEGEALLRQLIAAASGRGYLRLQGRGLWSLGLVLEERGALGESVVHYAEAEQLLERARDYESLAVVRVRLARFFDQVNDRARAWELMMRAFEHLGSARRYRRDAIFRGAAMMATGMQLPGAALAFQEGPFQEALAARSPGGLAFLYPDRARAFESLGLHQEALAALVEGRAWLAAIGDPSAGDMAAAVHHRAAAQVHGGAEPGVALDALTRTLDLYRLRENDFVAPEIQLGRARLMRRLGRASDAESALLDGISSIERRRDSMRDRAERVRVAALGWSLYRELADLYLKSNRIEDALEILERGRNPAAPGSPGLDEVAQGAVRVTYGVLPSGVVGTVQTPRVERVFRVDRSPQDLARLVDAYRSAILDHDAAAMTAIGMQLSRALLGPVAAELRGAAMLAVVPDPVLASLPFSTLPLPWTARPLVEAMAVLLERAATRPAAPSRAATPALVIGDPESSPDLALPRLPGARSEALGVAAEHSAATVLLGAEATRAAFAARAEGAAVIHFGGHAFADESDQTLSRLIVAPSQDDPLGVLFDTDLSALDLTSARVVVLAACDTGRTGQSAGPAVFGFARTFLDAGAASVVATLWPVGDRESGGLFLRLHRYLREGLPVAAALRRAQLDLFETGADPADWAGVIAVGENARIGG